MSIQRVQLETTSSEFYLWSVFLEGEERRASKNDHYLAQIAAEVRRGYVKNPKRVKVKDFLFKYPEKRKKRKMPEDLKERMSWSKAFWRGLTSVGKKK